MLNRQLRDARSGHLEDGIGRAKAPVTGIRPAVLPQGPAYFMSDPSAPVERNLEDAPLPEQNEGGFQSVVNTLDRRGREWSTTVRLIERHRHHLEAVEYEQARLYEHLSLLGPQARESGDRLKAVLEAATSGDLSDHLWEQFDKGQAALDTLEDLAGTLLAKLLWIQAAWEQYSECVVSARRPVP